MIINLRGHQLTPNMFNEDDHWGPFFESGALRIGHWVLGTKNHAACSSPAAIAQDVEVSAGG